MYKYVVLLEEFNKKMKMLNYFFINDILYQLLMQKVNSIDKNVIVFIINLIVQNQNIRNIIINMKINFLFVVLVK